MSTFCIDMDKKRVSKFQDSSQKGNIFNDIKTDVKCDNEGAMKKGLKFTIKQRSSERLQNVEH